jgi:hypothetical protein
MQQGQFFCDHFHVYRRPIVGLSLVGAGILLVVFWVESQELYRDIFHLQERNAFAFYLMCSGLLVLAFLTSIFPASIIGVLAGTALGIVKGFAISSAVRRAADSLLKCSISTDWRRGCPSTVGDMRSWCALRRSLRSVLPVTDSA